MVVLIDNYDSFSYNLYQIIGRFDPNIEVVRNDQVTIEEIKERKPTHLILSPGPGKPSEAGICEEVVKAFAGRVPILGVCLGHQAICEVYGARVTYAKQMMHGKTSEARLDTQSPLFLGMADNIQVARYHSLAAQRDTIPKQLHTIAESEDGEVMAVAHRQYPVFGLQFHPESILTPCGGEIIERFLKMKIESNPNL